MSRSASNQLHTAHSERAQWAWRAVSAIWDEHQQGKLAKEYATQVRKLPARIQTNGLGQSLAFLYSKTKKEPTAHESLLRQLDERINLVLSRSYTRRRRDDIMTTLVQLTPDEYRRCTHELLKTAEWLKRFVEGLFEKDDE